MKLWKSLVKGSFLVVPLVVCAAITMPEVKRSTKKDSKERQCLVEALTHEALNQPIRGQMAVLDVIKNRVNDKRFPNSTCGVVHQSKAFSYRNDLRAGTIKYVTFRNPIDKVAIRNIENLVDWHLKGSYTPVLSNSAMWYTRIEIKRSWMKNMQTEVVLGSHKFMKEI